MKTASSIIFLLFSLNIFSAVVLTQIDLPVDIDRAVTEANTIGVNQYEVGGISTILSYENQINLTNEQIIFDVIDDTKTDQLTNIINNICPEISKQECADKIIKRDSSLLIHDEYHDIITLVKRIRALALSDDYMAWMYYLDSIINYIEIDTFKNGYTSYSFGYKEEKVNYFAYILISNDQKKVLVSTAEYHE